VYLVSGSRPALISSFAGGVLIDLDHVLDYYLHHGPTLRIRRIYFWFIERKYEFVFLFFHSLEFLAVFWLGVLFFRLGMVWIALGVGLTQHLCLDIIFNREIRSVSYLISYRAIKKFKKEPLMKDSLPER
jgi:uncharacterized membrane protein